MKCQFCGNELADDQIFCGYCGHRVVVKTKRVCPSCGHEAAADELFCGRCGTRLSDGGSRPPESTQIRVLVNEQQQAVIEIPADATGLKAELKAFELARRDETIQRMLDGKRIISQTYEPGQYVNFMVEEVQRPVDEGGDPNSHLLFELDDVLYFVGQPLDSSKALNSLKAVGTLRVYRDRLELGKAKAKTPFLLRVKKDFCWYFKDITDVKEGRYGTSGRLIVITMWDGKTYSFFSSSLTPDKIKNVVETINCLLNIYSHVYR